MLQIEVDLCHFCTIFRLFGRHPRPMGRYVSGSSLDVSRLYQLWRFEKICLAGTRGFDFDALYLPPVGIVGLSQARHNQSFTGLSLDGRLEQKNCSARCGLMVIDLRSGDVVHSLSFKGIFEELYDVAVLQRIRQPSAIGFKTDEIRRVLHMK